MSSQPSSTASKEITINASSLLSGLAFGLGAGAAAGAVYYLLNKESGSSGENSLKNSRSSISDTQFPSPKRPSKSQRPATQSFQSKKVQRDSSGDRWDHWDKRNSVTVRVPATSANLGSGFDSVGIALDMWSEITVERADKFSMTCEGAGAEQLQALQEKNLVCVGVKTAFEYVGEEMPPLKYHCINRIPFGKGLGSSSAAIVGGLIAGLALCGKELKVFGKDSLYSGGGEPEPEELLQLACKIEGHPDNVAPALYGGIQLGIKMRNGKWRSSRVNCPPDLQMVAYIPNLQGITSELRQVLKNKVTRNDAIFNIGRVAFLVNALSQNKLYDLRYGTEDVLHQPPRSSVYPYLYPLMNAALGAGAHAVYLSGAGPTVLAITSGAAGDTFTQHGSERMERAIADAMILAGQKHCSKPGNVYITRPVMKGAYIVRADPPFSQGVFRYPGSV
eukprot:g12496.t1